MQVGRHQQPFPSSINGKPISKHGGTDFAVPGRLLRLSHVPVAISYIKRLKRLVHMNQRLFAHAEPRPARFQDQSYNTSGQGQPLQVPGVEVYDGDNLWADVYKV